MHYPAASAYTLESIINALADPGWLVLNDFVSPAWCRQLRADAEQLLPHFCAAGIGHHQDYQQQSTIRGDRIGWLDDLPSTIAISAYQQRLQQLQTALNRQLYLGLDHFEGHLASYAPGRGYQRHYDQFHDSDARVVTTILYLNPDWQPADGGLLRLWPAPQQAPNQVIDIAPIGGRLVIFLSDRYPHQVLPAAAPRFSLTGWFRRRPS